MTSMATKPKTTGEKTTPKSGTGGDSKSHDLDILRKNVAKRSLHVKFDLDDTGYQPIEKIGIGAYGVVCSAIHKKSTDRVAIKKIPFVFQGPAIAKRTYREIKILKHFKHDNIISIREILKPKESYHDFKDIYVVFDLMESDLHRIIYSEQPLTEEHIRYFLYQILRGLKYIHSANVVHRDLKPSNLLVNEDCHVRIGDFGMARGVNSQPEEPSHYMTQYVATRWYRAPEILLSLLEYDTAVDMWSVGCIFAEMLGRKHLFPGNDYLTQVKLVLGILGTPSETVLKNCQNDVLRRIIKSLGHRQPMAWTTLFPKASKKALDLLGKMLVMNPADRITVERALKHPFLSKYHDPDDEPICVPSFEFDFEKELLTMDSEQLRSVIYKEIMEFHQPRTPTLSFLACLRPAPRAEEGGEGAVEEGGGGGGVEVGPGVVGSLLKDQLQAMILKVSGQAEAKEESAGGLTSVSALPTSQGGAPPPQDAVPTQVTASHDHEEVFKKPMDKPATKKSPVSVDTANLQIPLSDVEMLSAQSTEGSKAMDTQTPRTPVVVKQEVEKETKPGDKKAENKTISEDTKALVKQALLSHRHRTESCGDDDKPRPMTAAQRQREREEKRKRKRDNKMKKMQDKKKEAPKDVELSDADKELLARWSSMQKRTDSSPQGPTTISPSSSAATLVYKHHGNPATPSPPHPTPAVSPPHPVPSSTPPSLLPAVGGLPPGQVAMVAGSVGQGQIGSVTGQMVLPQNLPENLGQVQVTLAQGQAEVLRRAGSRSSLQEGSVVPLVELQRHSTGQLHITPTQANALREVLKLSPSNARRESGGGDAGEGRPLHTPPLTTVIGHSTADVIINAVTDPSSSPHHGSPSPSLGQPGFIPSPESILNPSFSPQSVSPQPSFAQKQVTNSPQPPQNLSEFLERHYQKSEPAGTFPVGGFQSSDPATVFPGGAPANHESSGVKQEHNLFESCQWSALKPEVDFLDSKSSATAQQLQGGGQFGNTGQNTSVASNFHSNLFSGDAGPNAFYTQQGQAVGPHPVDSHPVGPHPVGAHPPLVPTFFMAADSGVDFGGAGHHLPSSAATMATLAGQESVDGSGHVSLPFSRYSELAPDFHLLGSRDGTAQGGFQMGSHSGVTPDMMTVQASMTPDPIATHPVLPQTVVGSHPNLGQVSIGSHPNLAQAGGMGGGHAQMGQAGGGVPSNSFEQRAMFQTPQPLHAHAASHLPHPHPHHQPPIMPHASGDASNPHPHPHSLAEPHPQPPKAERRGPDLRVSAPKQENVDLVAMLSNKLSSIFPPSLSLTPRGTGAGYGVGMDLDILMADAADNAGRGAELSPLSSSLLADWLDVSGNISQADLDALERDFSMTSPMAMSYTEFTASSNNSASNNNSNNNDTTSWG